MPLRGEYEPSPVDWVRNHVAKYEASNGVEGIRTGVVHVVILTMIGAKTGKLRKVPLVRVEHGGVYLAVASDSGAPRHPGWYFNILANPSVQLQDGPVIHDMIAREVVGEERELWWAHALLANPQYADYEASASSRVIPLLVLEEHVTTAEQAPAV